MREMEPDHIFDAGNGIDIGHDDEEQRGRSRLVMRSIRPGGEAAEPQHHDIGFADAINAGLVQRTGHGDLAHDVDTKVSRAARGSGHALPDDLRGMFERSLGTDLGGVRVHTHAAAGEASEALGARAYAMGQDVFMGVGQYNPGGADGAQLLAHEVAHTVQQRDAPSAPQMKLEVSAPGDALEADADRAADAMLRGEKTSVMRSTGLARTISRWANPASSRAVLDLIAHGAPQQLQAIILALETARANQVASGAPVPVSVPGLWSGMVDPRDLMPLEAEARRRWRAQTDERNDTGGDENDRASGGVQASGILDRLRGRGGNQPPVSSPTPLAAQRGVAQGYLRDVGAIENDVDTRLEVLEERAAAYNRALEAHREAMRTPDGDSGDGVIRARQDLERSRDSLRELAERAETLHRGARGVSSRQPRTPGGSDARLTRGDEIIADLAAEEAALSGAAPQSSASAGIETQVRAAEARLEAAQTRIAQGLRAANDAVTAASGIRPVPPLALPTRNRGGGGGGSSGPPPAGGTGGTGGTGGPSEPSGPAAPRGASRAAAEPVVEGPPPVEGPTGPARPPAAMTPPRTAAAVVEETPVPPSASGRVTMNGAGRFTGGLHTAMGVANVAGIVMMAIEMSRDHYDMYALPAGTRVWGLEGWIFRTRIEGTIVIEGSRHYVRWDNGRTTEIQPERFDPNTVA